MALDSRLHGNDGTGSGNNDIAAKGEGARGYGDGEAPLPKQGNRLACYLFLQPVDV